MLFTYEHANTTGRDVERGSLKLPESESCTTFGAYRVEAWAPE